MELIFQQPKKEHQTEVRMDTTLIWQKITDQGEWKEER